MLSNVTNETNLLKMLWNVCIYPLFLEEFIKKVLYKYARIHGINYFKY